MKRLLLQCWQRLLYLAQPLLKQVTCSIKVQSVGLAMLILQELNKVIDEDLTKIIVKLSKIKGDLQK
jgi:hypothetical protein